MDFNPSTTICLCNVDFDNSYKNVRYFPDPAAQKEYFRKRVVKSLLDHSVVRTKLPGGGVRSSVRVGMNIEAIRSLPCNYLYYTNANHGNRIFYAFITELIYHNEGMTELVIETDVYQTWFDSVTFLPSYVVREHHKTDNYFVNLVPESFAVNDFVYTDTEVKVLSDKWQYLVGCSNPVNFEDTETVDVLRGHTVSGIYQGLYFYARNGGNSVNALLETAESQGTDCVQFIACIPSFCVPTGDGIDSKQGLVLTSHSPQSKTVYIPDFAEDPLNLKFDGYKPKNKKLYTSPYFKLIVSNHNGESAEYNIEDFYDPRNIEFRAFGDVSANPSVTLIPQDYKGLENDYDNGISISNFPQCSYSSDAYKLWLTKNQFATATSVIGDMASIVGGVAAGAGGAVSGNLLMAGGGAATVVQGVKGIAETIDMHRQAKMEPNRTASGGSRSNLVTGMDQNNFVISWRKIKYDDAQALDDFFTMYGYKTNRVKVPNLSSRPAFNYVQTIDINVKAAIPQDDLQKFKAIFNRGVTLWKSHVDVGDYSIDNQPTE